MNMKKMLAVLILSSTVFEMRGYVMKVTNKSEYPIEVYLESGGKRYNINYQSDPSTSVVFKNSKYRDQVHGNRLQMPGKIVNISYNQPPKAVRMNFFSKDGKTMTHRIEFAQGRVNGEIFAEGVGVAQAAVFWDLANLRVAFPAGLSLNTAGKVINEDKITSTMLGIHY